MFAHCPSLEQTCTVLVVLNILGECFLQYFIVFEVYCMVFSSSIVLDANYFQGFNGVALFD